MRKYYDTTSLTLDILGELPTHIKQEEEQYVGMNVSEHKTGSTICVCKTKNVGKQAIASSRRGTYGSNLRFGRK